MGKYYGPIGYAAESKETSAGVWKEQIIERTHCGDMIRNTSKVRDGENLNSNLVLDNKLSIVADPYALEHFHNMRYIKWMGASWKITSVEVQRPRLILTIGDVYNEQTETTT